MKREEFSLALNVLLPDFAGEMMSAATVLKKGGDTERISGR